MHTLKKLLKKVLPVAVMNTYYKGVAHLAAFLYGNPSRKMIIVGVTGTKGKSTTSNILWRILTEAGYTVGLTGTINTRIGGQNMLNTNKMTMTGRFGLQRILRNMVRAGCDVAIIETTSEGIKQWRHIAIAYDIAAFTNLTPEHLEAHGGFENYKAAKLQLFEHLAQLPPKQLPSGKHTEVPRVSTANVSSEHGEDFLKPGAHTKMRFGRAQASQAVTESKQTLDIAIANIEETLKGTAFTINGKPAFVPLLGAWNADNAAAAAGIAKAFGLSDEQIISALAKVDSVPGRMEFIDEGQPFHVVVDYAYEPVSLRLLFEFCRKVVGPQQNIITLISSTGGGRDIGRRKPNGQVAGELCDYVIVTDEDPYDDDPQEIIDQVAEGVAAAGKIEGKNFWRILDRTEAITKAVSLAQAGDVVLTTAKGAEQKMVLAGGRKIDWDDRKVIRDALKELV